MKGWYKVQHTWSQLILAQKEQKICDAYVTVRVLCTVPEVTHEHLVVAGTVQAGLEGHDLLPLLVVSVLVVAT